MMGSKTTQGVFAIRQPKKVLISLGQSLVPRLYGVLGEHLHRRQKNQGY